MLTPLKQLLSSFFSTGAGNSPLDDVHSLQLATTVLLVEVMRCDTHITELERSATVAALRKKFALSDDQVARLMAHAEHAAKGANDYFRFTSAMNEQFTHAQKIQVIEHMWEVAYADAHLDAHENHVISKIAGLLHVTHGEYIAAKLHAKQAAQGSA
ncbi:MAG: TerB family tellurite resistance protein [Gammaproteobacteria bacterium]|nr:TerB family tellurite resistance protein [Gammaproteobacteria bacterium]